MAIPALVTGKKIIGKINPSNLGVSESKKVVSKIATAQKKTTRQTEPEKVT